MKLNFFICCLILIVSCKENKSQNEWDEYYSGNFNGKPEVRVAYYEGDSVIKQIIRFNKFGQQDGVLETFYENGKIKKIEYYKDGVLNGLRMFFYENGLIESVENYSEGLKDGWFYGYYEDGGKHYQIRWIKDKRQSAIEFDKNGRIIFQE